MQKIDLPAVIAVLILIGAFLVCAMCVFPNWMLMG